MTEQRTVTCACGWSTGARADVFAAWKAFDEHCASLHKPERRFPPEPEHSGQSPRYSTIRGR